MKFREAVEATVSIRDAYRDGLQALRHGDRKHVDAQDRRSLAGSVDLDTACKHSHPNDPRWDYAVAYQRAKSHPGDVFWIEVHPVRTEDHRAEVRRKFDWLKVWLAAEGKRLRAFPAFYVWIASGKTSFTSTSPQIRALAQLGVLFAGRHYRIR